MTTQRISPLVLGENLSLDPERLVDAGPNSPRVLIIGGGVIGLTQAWVLLDRGYHVTVVAKEWASFGTEQRLTSQIAGALWEYPPAVCGQHTDAISLSHSKRWAMVAYQIWDAVAADAELSAASGVRTVNSHFFFPHAMEQNPAQLQKMLEMQRAGIRGFVRDRKIKRAEGISPAYGAVDSYEILAPVIDTDQAMSWLQNLVKSKGADLITETLRGDLIWQEDTLLERFNADLIVNCTGLAGAELAGDTSCYPIRGGLIRVINDGRDFPKITRALTISADVANEIVFIVPRNDNILLIGGITEPNKWDLDLSLESPIIQRMRRRCEEFLPDLKKARLDEEYPFAQGLRPFRGQNVRIERELRRKARKAPEGDQVKLVRSRIIHSYGHGGAGWSLGFGCAADVANLVKDVLDGKEAEPMRMDESQIRHIIPEVPKRVDVEVPMARL